MKRNHTYPDIDMERTGDCLRRRIYEAGFVVKDIQEYLHLSCPQPIYRWFKGRILPSVNHLFMLSKLLDVHMEDLLVQRLSDSDSCGTGCERESRGGMYSRLRIYCERLCPQI